MKKYLLVIMLSLFALNTYSNDSIVDSSYYVIKNINIKGNKRTKDKIIIRELLFQKNDSICLKKVDKLIEQSRLNLLNTLLFNFVTVEYLIKPQTKDIEICIDVLERWYLWPFPIIEFSERNFNIWWKTKKLSRINYGTFITDNNFRGMKELLEFKINFGYDRELSVLYQIPYINKNQNFGIGFAAGFIFNHETRYNTFNNKVLYFKDDNNYVKKSFYSQFILTYRKKIHNTHYLFLSYNHFNFLDTLIQLNPMFSCDNESRLKYFSLKYIYKNDYRDFKSYPLVGHYFDFHFLKNGFNIFGDKSPNMFTIESTYKKYCKLKKRFYFASSLTAKISSNKMYSYFLRQALENENDFIRAYEYYAIDGENLVLFKSNFKYALIPNKVQDLDFIPIDKFKKLYYALYLNLFFDAGYVEDKQFNLDNSLYNEFLFGTGIGVDFVTYYDLVFRLEWSVNKIGDSGVFLHFIAPI